MTSLSYKQVVSLIKSVGHKRTVIVRGENGVGKTSIQNALRQDPDFAGFNVMHPIDCTQLSDGSVWMPDIDRDNGVSHELPNARFGVSKTNRRGFDGSRPSIICLDEVLKCPQYIKNMLAPIQYERRVGDYELPEGSIVWCATNLSVEGLGDTIQPHLRTRVIMADMRKSTQQEWKNDFAIPAGLNPYLIAFTDLYPDLFDSFLDYEEGGKYAGKALSKDNPRIFNPRVAQDGYFSPRTAHAASDVLDAAEGMDGETLKAALAGTIGESAAGMLMAVVNLQSDVPSFERVVADPEAAPLPSNPNAQLVQVNMFLTRSRTREEASAVVTYVQRMRTEMQTLFTNTVANSTRVALFGTVMAFQQMLKDNKLFLNLK